MAAPGHEAWVRVGEMLRDRRFALDRRYAAPKGLDLFADEHGINRRLAWDIETAYRANFSPGTLLQVEDAYELVPGSIRQALAGGEFTEAESGVPPVPADAPEVVRDNWQHEAVRVVWTTALPEDVRLGMISYYLRPGEESARRPPRRRRYGSS